MKINTTEKSPIFEGVALGDFFRFISGVLRLEVELLNPVDFAREFASRSTEEGYGSAKFAAIPTPRSEWGWLYETVSGRQLTWLPGGTVVTTGLTESRNFRSFVEKAFGKSTAAEAADSLELLGDAYYIERCDKDCRQERRCSDCGVSRDNDLILERIEEDSYKFFSNVGGCEPTGEGCYCRSSQPFGRCIW